MNRDTGAQAFPASRWTKDGDFIGDNQGMTLRDYFAAKALPLIWSDVSDDPALDWEETLAEAARLAYTLADAMLKERAK